MLFRVDYMQNIFLMFIKITFSGQDHCHCQGLDQNRGQGQDRGQGQGRKVDHPDVEGLFSFIWIAMLVLRNVRRVRPLFCSPSQHKQRCLTGKAA